MERECMSLIISRRAQTKEWQYRPAFGLSEIFGVGMAILERGDDLIFIAPNKEEFPIEVELIRTAKRNRDRHIRDGVVCQPLPPLSDYRD
jgi:hypothetical protein